MNSTLYASWFDAKRDTQSYLHNIFAQNVSLKDIMRKQTNAEYDTFYKPTGLISFKVQCHKEKGEGQLFHTE